MPWVRPYVRSDGTAVQGHARWAPGARRGMTIFAVVALAAVGLGGNASVGKGIGAQRQLESTVQYPIRFPSPGRTR